MFLYITWVFICTCKFTKYSDLLRQLKLFNDNLKVISLIIFWGYIMLNRKITIQVTSNKDLENTMSLWNNGTVMHYVGYPNGLNITKEKLEKWLPLAIQKPKRCHYSIYSDDTGYCGETFYDVNNESHTVALDIKLLPKAQGKGIAKIALTFAINQAFEIGKAERVYVDPHPENIRAFILYEKLGFVSKPRPKYLEDGETYLEITRIDWVHRNS
jgi:RimJ/RimL family protein N-acetyltransferase